jgi:Zn-dependent protease
LDLALFLYVISIWAIPVLFAITLHEVAHGFAARYFGDRTAELLGRLNLNPLRHIDPIGTVLIPGSLLALGFPPFGWAKPVPTATHGLRNPRRTSILVALAGPAANLAMALLWCAVLAVLLQIRRGQTLDNWVVLMAQAGIKVNAVLALFNLLPIPPLDGSRVLANILPVRVGGGFEKIAPAGMFIIVGLLVLGMFGWLYRPAYRGINQLVSVLGIGVAT